MCLAAIAWQAHPRYRLVLIANRDEFHARPTEELNLWSDREGVLAGRDLQAGGTWLGWHRSGRFGLITNYRDQQSPQDAPTRGNLIPDFLDGPQTPGDYLAALAPSAARYAGFNLLLGDLRSLWYASNRQTGFLRPLEPGVFALSNHLLDTPWPKLSRLRKALERWLSAPTGVPQAGAKQDVEPLWQALTDRTPADDHHLPETGISLEWERRLSPPFIVHPEYGTRCSTLLRVDHADHMEVEERSYGRDGEVVARQCWQGHLTQWPPAPNSIDRLA